MKIEHVIKNFPVGTKVIPHSKSILKSAEECPYFTEDLPKQGYLYVLGHKDLGDEVGILLGSIKNQPGGNYYLEKDLKKYIEKKTKYLF